MSPSLPSASPSRTQRRHRRPLRWGAVIAAAVALVAALLLVFVAPPAMAAGQVEVNFVEPRQFADIGRTAFEQDRHLESLGGFLRKLGARLPDGQRLVIDVTDVDLAGEPNPLGFDETRVLRGRADWPRIVLRWSLQGAGGTLASGEDRLADMTYLFFPARPREDTDLPYEKRLLEAWFVDRVGGARR